jgi:hypothetical protein
MNVGTFTCIVLSVAALKDRDKITGVVRPLVSPRMSKRSCATKHRNQGIT